MIRSVLEYACPVWHCGLTLKDSTDLEGVQKRVLRILFPDLHYSEALTKTGIERLDSRRERIVRELFERIKEPGHLLHHLLPMREKGRDTRDCYPFKIQQHKSARFCRSLINYCIMRRF